MSLNQGFKLKFTSSPFVISHYKSTTMENVRTELLQQRCSFQWPKGALTWVSLIWTLYYFHFVCWKIYPFKVYQDLIFIIIYNSLHILKYTMQKYNYGSYISLFLCWPSIGAETLAMSLSMVNILVKCNYTQYSLKKYIWSQTLLHCNT